jgi:protein phosphatase
VALAGAQAYVAHVGDTRAYHWRDGRLTQLTSDHSEAAELVRMRILKPERVRDHPGRSTLTRTLGSRLIPRPDYLRHPIAAGDQFVLCSDGLWSELDDEELCAILSKHEPQSAARQLMQLALDRDCQDNVTVQVIRVVNVEAAPAPSRNGWLSTIFQRGQA